MRMPVRSALAGIALFAVSGMAEAAEDCAALDTTQMGLNECFGRQAEASDKELNRLYRQLQDRLAGEPDKQKLLQGAQRAWMAFRDAECAFGSSGVEGGSAQPMVISQCLADLTEMRNAELKVYAGCEEGDLACPVPQAR